MTGKVNDGAKTVHVAGTQYDGDYPYPLCQPGGRYKLTRLYNGKPATCKRCLLLLKNEGRP